MEQSVLPMVLLVIPFLYAKGEVVDEHSFSICTCKRI